jgi:hypothetical protein
VPERPDVLGQAPAAEAEARPQPGRADPGITAEHVGQNRDVRPGRLAHFGHRVDEGDLGGQEGIRGRLGQLGRGQVGEQQRRACVRQLAVDIAQHCLGVSRAHAGHDPGRAQGVGHGVPLAQELRIPGEFGSRAGRRQRGQPVRQGGGGADRRGGLRARADWCDLRGSGVS